MCSHNLATHAKINQQRKRKSTLSNYHFKYKGKMFLKIILIDTMSDFTTEKFHMKEKLKLLSY